jgi:nucleoside-diphosphate-sugar epimerase
MARVLVTGGAGFIGYHLARHLLQNTQHEIVLADNLWRGKHDRDLVALLENPRINFVQGDLTDPAFLPSLTGTFDQVYHLAAVNGTRLFYEVPHEVLRINIISLFNILDWVKAMEKKPRLLFTSSNEAYAGALESFGMLPLPTPEDVPLVVSDVYNPRWTYGGSKLIGELMVIHYAKSFGIPAVIVRPHNFYGPRAGYDHVIPQMIARIEAHGEPFAIYGADETRSFCYIEDAVRAMRHVMEAADFDTEKADIFHIGSDEETNIAELAEVLFDIAGWHPEEITAAPSKKGSVKRRLPDVSKLKAATAWSHDVSLREGLRETFEWYQKHTA